MSALNRGFIAVVHGRVQGVGFRWSTCRIALDLGLVGRVRNLPDGSVEVIAEGPEPEVAALRAWLATGPRGARVDRLSVAERTPLGIYTTFEIG